MSCTAPCRLAARSIVPLLVLVTVASAARAQTLQRPVTVLNGNIGTLSLATGWDGDVLQLGKVSDELAVRFFQDPTSAPGGASTFHPLGAVARPGLTALPGGGFAVVGSIREDGPEPNVRVVAQRFSPNGVPLGLPIPASDLLFTVGGAGIGPAGDGFVVGYRTGGEILGQRFDATGTPVGPRFVAAQEQFIANVKIAAVGGGFLMAWGRDFNVDARLFAADATPLGPVFTVTTSFECTALAVNPAGTLAAIVGPAHETDPSPGETRVRFFAPDGSSLGSDLTVGTLAADAGVASDAHGNFLVVGGSGLHARAYDATGAPLGALQSFAPPGGPGNGKVSHLRGGGFFAIGSATMPAGSKTYVAHITLCTPGTSVCGDGALSPTCEVCDDGAANSDSAPDACRTDCTAAYCGDGTADSDEQCDDGNGSNCDGCNEYCEIEAGAVCGDGTLAPPGCTETCDDGNVAGGDGCSPTCGVEHIHGGGKSTTDCYAAWRIANTSNEPRFDKRGSVNPKQRCRDDDPACDFDGGVAGSCTFHLAVCANNSVPVDCAPSRLLSWAIASPSAKQAATRPALAAVRSALQSVVLGSIVGPGDPDFCSPDAEVVLPLRGRPDAYKASKLKLKTRAEIYSGAVDTDGLLLRCDP